MSPFTIRPAYTDTDYTFVVTVDAFGDTTPLGDWTLTAALYDSGANLITTDIGLAVLDADALTLTVTILGQSLTFGDYGLILTRTDTGKVADVYVGTLEVTNPLNQLGWGTGFYAGS